MTRTLARSIREHPARSPKDRWDPSPGTAPRCSLPRAQRSNTLWAPHAELPRWLRGALRAAGRPLPRATHRPFALRELSALGWIGVLAVAFPALAAASEGGSIINLDRSLIVQVVNFLLLLVVLWRFLYRPLLAKLEERSEKIRQSLAEAQAAQAEALRQREEHRRQLQGAYAEAQSVRAEALRAAAEEQRRLIDSARAEAGRIVESARAEIEQDVLRARQELQKEAGDLAVSVAERLIRKSLREEDHRGIVREALERLERAR